MLPITITFKPTKNIDNILLENNIYPFKFKSIAFLHLFFQPLKIIPIVFNGIGIGSNITLDLYNLDVGDIILGETHEYDINCYNNGKYILFNNKIYNML